MSRSLVVLAAGLGSRFGGTKQLESVGPNGEAFLDLSIVDALAAGLDNVVLIVRTDIEEMVQAHLESQHDAAVLDRIRLVYQDQLGPARAKPWGTVHAVLSASSAIDGPFVVVNADDHYGAESIRLAAAALDACGPDAASLVTFPLGMTVPTSGSVTRGVCSVSAEGVLDNIEERRDIEWDGDKLVSELGALGADAPVSMNLWCFDQSILESFEAFFGAFLDANADDPKAECLLPDAVAARMAEGMIVRADATSDRWIGVTNPDDLEPARALLREIRS